MKTLAALLAVALLGGCATARTADDFVWASEQCDAAYDLVALRIGVLESYEGGMVRADIESGVLPIFTELHETLGEASFEGWLDLANEWYHDSGIRVGTLQPKTELVAYCMNGYLS